MNNARKLTVVLTALLIVGGPSLARPAETVNIVPPDAKFKGKTYDAWAASFWQWMLAYPLDGHPAIDAPNFDFAARQSGKVWYWAAPEGPLTRTATLPAGKPLLLSIRDVECSSLEAVDSGFHGDTEAEQRDCAKFWADHIRDVFCKINGADVPNLQAFRFSTPQFAFTAPTPWIFGATGGTGTSVGDGYFLMLQLPKGHYTIHYGGTFHFDAGELDENVYDFVKDITIEITVSDDDQQ